MEPWTALLTSAESRHVRVTTTAVAHYVIRLTLALTQRVRVMRVVRQLFGRALAKRRGKILSLNTHILEYITR